MPSKPFRLVPAAALVLAAPLAWSQASGMVSVELTNVSDGIAQRLGVDEARMPMSILVPVDVAAAACRLPAETLAPHATRGGEGCTASAAVPQLDRFVHMRMSQDEALGGPPAPAGAPPSATGTAPPGGGAVIPDRKR